MPRYFEIMWADAPWGDYGSILINGLAETSYEDRSLKEVRLSRTGPFVPPITQPNFVVIVVDDMRRALEAAGYSGLGYIEVRIDKLVRYDWETWDPEKDSPSFYPDSGEPEDYILAGTHDPSLLDQIPRLWALDIPDSPGLTIYKTDKRVLARDPVTDIARDYRTYWVSEPLKDWLDAHAGRWVRFLPAD